VDDQAAPVVLSRRLAIAGLVFAVFAVYANSFGGAFVFDDFPAIVESPYVRHLWPVGEALRAPAESTTSGRPAAAFSFALSYALAGGYDTWMYHAMNTAIHACAALALFGVVRLTLLMPPLRHRFGRSSTSLALSLRCSGRCTRSRLSP
jgi:protein O-mannosyl-transferase